MDQDTLLQTLRAVAPGIAGAIASVLVMKWLYKNIQGETHLKTPDADVFTYPPKLKRFMTWLGLACLAFAIGPLIAVGHKYYGPDPMLASHPCYRLGEDWSAVICLFLGFGLGAIACLVDPRKYFAKLDDKGITVNGLFSGLQSRRWNDVEEIKDHPSFQLISVRGKDSAGIPFKLFVPYTVGGFQTLLQKLYEHGVFFREQAEMMKDMQECLTAQGITSVTPYRLYPPLMTLWKIPSTPERYAAVLAGVTEDGNTCLEHHVTTGTAEDLLNEIRVRLKNKGFGFHPDFQEDLALDMDEITLL